MLLFVTAVGVVLVVSFLCSIFESVLLSLTRPQIEILGKRHAGASRLLSRFKDNMDVPIAAILILNTAAHTIGAAVAGASYSNVFDASTLWIFSIIFTFAVLLFTEIIPKTLGVSYASALAAPVAHGIRILTMVLKPLVIFSETISRSLRRDTEIPVTSAEEIRLLASLGRSKGAVGETTAGMIVGATQLRYLNAHDVMLPREKVSFLSGEMNRDEATAYVRQTGHSRFPFTPTRDLKDTSATIMAKDLLYWSLQNDGPDVDWNALTKEALVVPESVPLLQLMRTYRETRRHLAIVVDEYGSVEGIATLEDVLEEIVGDIFDETDLAQNEFHEADDGTLLVRSSVDLRKLCARLGVAWDPDVETSTIGGLVTEMLDRIPVAGDKVDWNNHEIEVLRADKRRARILRIRSSSES
ncbi:MAG: hemolysin family protein [Gammaproteobacteria bacterium]|nr:hemolysin family protein [Gammaproteobacteria bacterium]